MFRLIFLPIIVAGSMSAQANEQPQWILGLGVGTADYFKQPLQLRPRTRFDKSDNAQSVSLAYGFKEWIEFELSYADLGVPKMRVVPNNIITLDQSHLKLDAQSFGLNAVISWPMTEQFSVSARLGVVYTDTKKLWSGGSRENPIFTADSGGGDTKALIGMRIQYQLNDHWIVGLNWDRYDVDELRMDHQFLQLRYRF